MSTIPNPYSVTVYEARATRLVTDQRYGSLRIATEAFHSRVEMALPHREMSVLLTRIDDVSAMGTRGTVLAHKSTDADRVVFEPAYYRELGARRRRLQQNLELALEQTRTPNHG